MSQREQERSLLLGETEFAQDLPENFLRSLLAPAQEVPGRLEQVQVVKNLFRSHVVCPVSIEVRVVELYLPRHFLMPRRGPALIQSV